MVSFRYTLTDEVGIHARPAGLLVKKAQEYECASQAGLGEKTADLKKIFSVMGLGAKQNDTLTFTCTGPDEKAAAAELEAYLKDNAY